MSNPKIDYPYEPNDGQYQYAPATNPYMLEARAYAKTHSLDEAMPNASVIVKNDTIIARGANGSDYHMNNVCERVKLKIPTGQGYELCEGCHPKNHSEPTAIRNFFAAGGDPKELKGAEIYLWGHWWCCAPCWENMKAYGIRLVYLLENSEVLFNKAHPDNIVGRQFA